MGVSKTPAVDKQGEFNFVVCLFVSHILMFCFVYAVSNGKLDGCMKFQRNVINSLEVTGKLRAAWVFFHPDDWEKMKWEGKCQAYFLTVNEACKAVYFDMCCTLTTRLTRQNLCVCGFHTEDLGFIPASVAQGPVHATEDVDQLKVM